MRTWTERRDANHFTPSTKPTLPNVLSVQTICMYVFVSVFLALRTRTPDYPTAGGAAHKKVHKSFYANRRRSSYDDTELETICATLATLLCTVYTTYTHSTSEDQHSLAGCAKVCPRFRVYQENTNYQLQRVKLRRELLCTISIEQMRTPFKF